MGDMTARGMANKALEGTGDLSALETEIKQSVVAAINEVLQAKLNKTGGEITGNVTVTGNLTVVGTNFIIDVETVEVKDNLLFINNGEIGNGVTAGYAGLEVDRGLAANYFMVFDEATEMFRVGMAGDLETIASQDYVNNKVQKKPDIHTSTEEPTDEQWADGDLWIVHEA